LRELLWAARAKAQHDWNQTSSIMAVIANTNRDPKRRAKPYEPRDFNPYAPPKQRVRVSASEVGKMLFAAVKHKVQ
jgi:hypothetical protein